jgi:hypothetical protein
VRKKKSDNAPGRPDRLETCLHGLPVECASAFIRGAGDLCTHFTYWLRAK